MRLQGVDSAPGSTFQYSNYGYSLLGRIIEAASGMDYEDYVQERVFDPLCISRMQIGSTLGNADNEVDYHDAMYEYRLSILDDDDLEWVHSPYGVNNIANFDAHGGWIGTAVDLVAFASAFRDPADSPLLTEASIDDMWDAPTSLSYSLGWDFKPGSPDRYHNGSITGTRSTMQRNNDGTTFAVVLNRRVGNDVPGYNSGDDDIRDALNDVWSSISWPEVDHWADYICPEFDPADINKDGVVDIVDLLNVLNEWGGFCFPFCSADINDDGFIDILDLLAVIAAWTT
jgi:CubicO group peptidase (beta-lactamase class C family)